MPHIPRWNRTEQNSNRVRFMVRVSQLGSVRAFMRCGAKTKEIQPMCRLDVAKWVRVKVRSVLCTVIFTTDSFESYATKQWFWGCSGIDPSQNPRLGLGLWVRLRLL